MPRAAEEKKAIWEKIHAEFIQACEEASISTDKSLTQVKEKWRTLFKKYKAVCDNNSKTGWGRESFEFYEIIDGFMGCSDKVRPRFVCETAVRNADLQSSPRAESTRDSSENGGVEIHSQDELQQENHDEAPTAWRRQAAKLRKLKEKEEEEEEWCSRFRRPGD